MGKPSVLVVDDDDSTRRYLRALLVGWGYEASVVASGEEALARLRAGPPPGVILLDLVMPGLGGLELLEQIRQDRPQVPVVILSTVGQIKTVVSAMSRGASDYLTKPFEEEELELAIQSALEKQTLREEVRVLRQRLDQREEDAVVSSNPRLLKIKEIARQVADTDAPILILGESGVGKEVVARYIHGQSARRDKPFVRVNCAALPQDLLESELFGYERGAFSGAIHEKPGKFELANGGSILLDEIGEMTPHLQAKLLHVLQDGEYSRLGGRHPVRTDARVLALTNTRLDESVAGGRFREDLYFRLSVIRVEVPPLRERREDIALLCQHFLQLYVERYKSPVRELPRELLDALLRHDWPGNVRELENAVRRYVILPDVEMALAELGRPRTGPEPSAEGAPAAERLRPRELSLRKVGARAAEEAERELVRRVLDETRWNRKEAARRLDISYKALLNKLKKWQLEARPEPPAPAPPSGVKAGADAAPGPEADPARK